MIARSTLFTVKGGDTIQVSQTAAHLGKRNISVDIKLTNEKIDYEKYDLFHFFNITRPADMLYHIRKSGKPFVVSTILVDYSEFDRQHRHGISGMLFRYLSHDSIEYLKTVTRWILRKDKLKSSSYLWKGQRRSIQEVLKKASLLVPNSHSEYERLQKMYQCNTPYLVVPKGIDPGVFQFDERHQKDTHIVG